MCLDPISLLTAVSLGTSVAQVSSALNQKQPALPKTPELPKLTLGDKVDYTTRLQKQLEGLQYGYEGTRKVSNISKNAYPLSGIFPTKFLLGQ